MKERTSQFGLTVLIAFHVTEFRAIEALRIGLKLNISTAREQKAVGLGPLVWLHHEALQGVKATSDTTLKTRDKGISNQRQANRMRR